MQGVSKDTPRQERDGGQGMLTDDEQAELVSILSRWLICRDVYGSILADDPDPAGVEEAAAGLQEATDNLERVARRCVG